MILDPATCPSQINRNFLQSIEEGKCEVLKYWIDQGADIYAEGGRALVLATSLNHVEIVRFLFQNGFKINKGELAVYWAAGSDETLDILKLLHQNGADIADENVLIWSAEEGAIAVLHYLKEQGVNLHVRGEIALSISASHGDYDYAEQLIQWGANPEIAIKTAQATRSGYASALPYLQTKLEALILKQECLNPLRVLNGKSRL